MKKKEYFLGAISNHSSMIFMGRLILNSMTFFIEEVVNTDEREI